MTAIKNVRWRENYGEIWLETRRERIVVRFGWKLGGDQIWNELIAKVRHWDIFLHAIEQFLFMKYWIQETFLKLC